MSESESPPNDTDTADSTSTDETTEPQSDPTPNTANEPEPSDTETPESGGFDAVIEAGTLRDAIKAVSVLVDECKLHIEERHVQIRAVDAANVGMVDVQLDASAFESYTGAGGVLGVDLDRFEDVIGMADSGELVSLQLNQTTRKLDINFGELDISMALLDPDTIRKEPDIPDLDLPATVTVEGGDLGRAKKAANMVAEHIRFRVDEESEAFIVKAEGDTDDVRFELAEDDLAEITAADAQSIFSLDYVKDLVKPLPKGTTATLLLGDDFPMKLEYELADGTVSITNMLAPRIESD